MRTFLFSRIGIVVYYISFLIFFVRGYLLWLLSAGVITSIPLYYLVIVSLLTSLAIKFVWFKNIIYSIDKMEDNYIEKINVKRRAKNKKEKGSIVRINTILFIPLFVSLLFTIYGYYLMYKVH